MVEIFHFFMKQVVPFTPSAGVLEWVNGTLPLGEYLIGRSVKENINLVISRQKKKYRAPFYFRPNIPYT